MHGMILDMQKTEDALTSIMKNGKYFQGHPSDPHTFWVLAIVDNSGYSKGRDLPIIQSMYKYCHDS